MFKSQLHHTRCVDFNKQLTCMRRASENHGEDQMSMYAVSLARCQHMTGAFTIISAGCWQILQHSHWSQTLQKKRETHPSSSPPSVEHLVNQINLAAV